MDKESSVRSNLIPDKVYKSPINTLDNEDNEVETDLYKIKIFGKNIIIAPGKTKSVNPKFIYFYIYAIKNEKVSAKLGVYEKELSSLEENPDIYDLTKFKDGSLLLFDVYYNSPDLINDLEELETLEEEVEEEEGNEEGVQNLGKNVKLETAEVIIDGNDYIMRDGQIFDLNDKKIGTKFGTNMIAWNNNSKPKSNLQIKDTMYNAFDYLKQAIVINKINVLNDEEQSGLVSKLRLLIRDQATNVSQKGKNIAERRKLTNILNEMFTAKNDMLLSNPTFFDNLKKIQKLKSAQNVIKPEEKTVIMLYILENFLDVNFVFKTKDYMDFDISKIINIKFSPNEMNKKKVIVLINEMAPFAEIASIKIIGTSLNEQVGLSGLEENVGLAALGEEEPANEEFNQGINEEEIEGNKPKNVKLEEGPTNYKSNVDVSSDNESNNESNNESKKSSLRIANVGSGNVGPGNVGSGNVGSGNVGSGNVGSGNVGPGNVGSGNVAPSNVAPGNIALGNVGATNVALNNSPPKSNNSANASPKINKSGNVGAGNVALNNSEQGSVSLNEPQSKIGGLKRAKNKIKI